MTYSCAVSPTTGYPGDPFTVTGTAMNLDPKKTATYTWTSTGGTISGTSTTATIATKTAAPGTYTRHGHVTEGAKPGQSADCTGVVYGHAVPAANDQLLGEPIVGQPGRLFDDYGERDEPAEPASDLQLQLDGRLGERQHARRRRFRPQAQRRVRLR